LRANANGTDVKRIIIFSIDAGSSTPAPLMMQLRNLQLWTTDPGRIVDIVGKRARAYRSVALNELRSKSEAEITIIKMVYTDAKIYKWPAACGKRKGGQEAITVRLRRIPTNLKITKCDAELLEIAARDVVTRALYNQRDNIEDAGIHFSPTYAFN